MVKKCYFRRDDAQASQATGHWMSEREWVFDFARDLCTWAGCSDRPEWEVDHRNFW